MRQEAVLVVRNCAKCGVFHIFVVPMARKVGPHEGIEPTGAKNQRPKMWP